MSMQANRAQSIEPLAQSLELNVSPASEIRLLRRSLIGFGLVGFFVPLLLAYVLDAWAIDPFAIVIGIAGLTLTQNSFRKFPWVLLAFAFYPWVMLSFSFSAEWHDANYWFLPTRGFNSPPIIFYAILTSWAILNTFHVIKRYGFHLANRPS